MANIDILNMLRQIMGYGAVPPNAPAHSMSAGGVTDPSSVRIFNPTLRAGVQPMPRGVNAGGMTDPSSVHTSMPPMAAPNVVPQAPGGGSRDILSAFGTPTYTGKMDMPAPNMVPLLPKAGMIKPIGPATGYMNPATQPPSIVNGTGLPSAQQTQSPISSMGPQNMGTLTGNDQTSMMGAAEPAAPYAMTDADMGPALGSSQFMGNWNPAMPSGQAGSQFADPNKQNLLKMLLARLH